MQIFELFGTVLLKDSGVESQLDKYDKKAQQTDKSMGISFGSIASAALKVGAVLGVGLGIKDMMETAAKGQDRMAQMNAVLTSTKGVAGMTQDALISLASAQSKLSLQSKGANIETENLLLTFTSIGKDVFPQALTTVNDMSQALGQDTKSSAVQLGKALQDPIKGITALSRVGVNFTAQQKEQIKAMEEAGNVAGAQKLILAELGTEFGGSALNASKTFDGQMTVLKNSLTGMGGSIANSVLPTLTSFVSLVNEHMPEIQAVISTCTKVIGDGLKTVTDFITTNFAPTFTSLQSWFTTRMPEMQGIFTDVMGVIKEVFKDVSDYVTQVVIPMYQKLYDWIRPYLPEIRDTFKEVFTVVQQVFKGVMEVVKNDVMPALDTLAKFIASSMPSIKATIKTMYDYVKPSFDALVKVFIEDVVPALQFLWSVVQFLMPVIKVIFEVALVAIGIALKLVIDIIVAVIETIKFIYLAIKPSLDLLMAIFGTVKDYIVNTVNNIKQVFTGIIDFITGVFTGNWQKAFEGLKNIVGGIFNQIVNVVKTPINIIIDLIDSLIGNMNNILKTAAQIPGIGNVLNGISIPMIPKLAKGTDNWQGGFALMNESNIGGEIVNLPNGSKVIPHDVSMEMAKNGSQNNQPILLVINLDGKEVARQIVDPMAEELARKEQRYSLNPSLGGAY